MVFGNFCRDSYSLVGFSFGKFYEVEIHPEIRNLKGFAYLILIFIYQLQVDQITLVVLTMRLLILVNLTNSYMSQPMMNRKHLAIVLFRIRPQEFKTEIAEMGKIQVDR